MMLTQAWNSFIRDLGGIAIFMWKVVTTFYKTRGNGRVIFEQIASISMRALPTVMFAGVFVGAILVLQFNTMLVQYDAQIYLGGLNTSSIIREVGPLIISFLLAGKIGAYTAAELGTMRVTEQIDAVECLGTDPIQYLVVPRYVGILASTLILLAVGLMVSIAGSMIVANVFCGINFQQYAQTIARFTSTGTFVSGMLKGWIYGSIVAAVCCYRGYTASGGAQGVGRAVTLAAVYTNLYIVIANYLISRIWIAFEALGGGT